MKALKKVKVDVSGAKSTRNDILSYCDLDIQLTPNNSQHTSTDTTLESDPEWLLPADHNQSIEEELDERNSCQPGEGE